VKVSRYKKLLKLQDQVDILVWVVGGGSGSGDGRLRGIGVIVRC